VTNTYRTDPNILTKEIDNALNELVRDILSPGILILIPLYIGFAIGHLYLISFPYNKIMFSIAISTAFVLVFLLFIFRKNKIPSNLAHPFCTLITLLVVINSVFHTYLLNEPKHTTNFMLLVIAVGSTYLSLRWYIYTLGLILASWGIVVCVSKPSPEWGHFGFALLTSTIVASIIHRARVTNFKNLIVLQLQEKQQKLELKHSKEELEDALMSLTASEAHTKSIINNMLVGLVTASEDGTIYSVNPAAEKIFDYKERELVGRPLQTLFSKHSTNVTGIFSDFLRNHLGQNSHLKAIKKDGKIFDIEFSLSKFTVNNQQYFSGHIKDISEQKEVDRVKTEFVASVSHELRTPLASIYGSLSLLSAGLLGNLTSESQEAVEIAQRNSKRLLGLINDILDYERLEKGTLEMQFEETKLELIVSRAVETVQTIANKEEISIEIQGVFGEIFVDEDRIAQVLVNLLSNAIKFSPNKGKIIVSSQELSDSIIIKVKDFGRGIPAKLHKQIFDRFKQVEASDSREKGGTGLGLAICKAIIEHHKGQIEVESIEGQGSTFSFSIPKLKK
jgi:PAS domain S-box-containing protein